MSTTPRQLGKYQLQELLGRGGMAEVWKAFDTQLQRYVAIKLLHANLQTDPDFIARFTREAQLIAGLRHPNIVQIYDFHISEDDRAEVDTIAYMVMEYIKGSTLAQYIHNTSHKKQFPPATEVIRLFTPISLAIDYAHSQGMIHRDIKPANILLDQRYTARNPMGEPILSDFGLAKLLSAPSQTMSGVVLGTPLYMSPEQVENRFVSKQTDIYALGVVLYEIFTGVPPFRGDSVSAIMMQHLTATPTEPHLANPNLPPALSAVLLKSLAKNPQDRFSSASTLTAAAAKSLNIAVPEDLKGASTEGEDQTLLVGQSPGRTPSSAATGSSSGASPDAPPAVASNAETIVSEPSTSPILPPPEAIGGSVITPPLLSSPPRPAFSKRWGLIAGIALLIVVLVGSGLGAFFLLTRHSTSTPTTVASNLVVGRAVFATSGKLNLTSNEGSNDEFQINLQNIPDPHPGNSYYAWLLPDKSQVEGAPLLLGKLTVDHGAIHFFYAGDSQHSNLLTTFSRFLITEESASITPSVPSPDLTAWRYYAELPQTPAPGQTYSLLDHLRHLLAKDPVLEALNLHAGLAIWAYRNTQKIQGWASGARDAWNTKDFATIHQNIVRILDYLDGEKFVGQDVQAGTPILVNRQYAQVGLLELNPGQQDPPSYLYHIALHLNGVLASPGATQYQRTEATQINMGVNNVNGWLGQLRRDAVQLVNMSDAQLALPSTLQTLNDMATQANNAFLGRNNPATGQQPGVSQIYRDVQLLATFDVKPYH